MAVTSGRERTGVLWSMEGQLLGPAWRRQAQEKGNSVLRIFGFGGPKGGSSCAKAAAALQTLRDGREGAGLEGANWVVVVLGAETKQKCPGQQGALAQQKSSQAARREPAHPEMGLEVTKAET